MTEAPLIAWLENLTVKDVPLVGGKNASLGEMIQKLKSKGIRVPGGFATTAPAYWSFVEHNGLEQKISELIKIYQKDEKKLPQVGKSIRQLFLRGKFPEALEQELCQAYRKLCRREKR
ncbi:MAG: PEP/pyruvate-binding domain-containing protein, partial [bacterium]|nr:PEP/pyruvate-binding domain-containing protein [bacterium]